MSKIVTNLKNPIIDNEDPWLFGAAYDDFTKEDFKYVIPADYGGPSEPAHATKML